MRTKSSALSDVSYSIFPKSTVYRRVLHHSHYISLTLPLWTCRRIIQYTIQSGRVLSAPATTSPFLSSGHNSLPQGVCMLNQSPETSMFFLCSRCPCFDSGCMLVARDECSLRSRGKIRREDERKYVRERVLLWL